MLESLIPMQWFPITEWNLFEELFTLSDTFKAHFNCFAIMKKKRILAIPWMKILKFIKSNLFFYDCIAQRVDDFYFNASVGMKKVQSWHLL